MTITTTRAGDAVVLRVAGRLDAMGDNDLSVAQQNVGEEVHEDAEKGALARAFCSGNEVNPVVKEIGER